MEEGYAPVFEQCKPSIGICVAGRWICIRSLTLRSAKSTECAHDRGGMEVRIQGYGERGFWIYSDALARAEVRVHLDELLLRAPMDGLSEHVWGASNLLLLFHEVACVERLIDWFAAVDVAAVNSTIRRPLQTIPVVYDGPDLDWLSQRLSLSVEELVAIHTDPEYTVRLMGFSPGFPYLDGLDARLHCERRATPRKRIAAGSVAIGGSHAGIYSVASPGGWHLLGRTEIPLFRPDRARGAQPPISEVFAFKPGDRIRFVPQ